MKSSRTEKMLYRQTNKNAAERSLIMKFKDNNALYKE